MKKLENNDPREETDIVVIGGGAAGLVAAISAAKTAPGSKIMILEKQSKLGRKLLATGNGRCNLSNRRMDYHYFHGAEKKYLKAVLDQFTLEQTIAFFSSLGLLIRKDEAGRIYPLVNEAKVIRDFLQMEVERLGISVCLETKVAEIQIDDQRMHKFKLLLETGDPIFACCVILAAGGAAAPQLGGDEKVYTMATALGLKQKPIFPALTPLEMADKKLLKRCSGVRFKGKAWAVMEPQAQKILEQQKNGESFDAKDIKIKNKEVIQGEFQMTDYGLSGIASMELSRFFVAPLAQNQKTVLLMDLLPNISAEELQRFFVDKIRMRPRITTKELLLGVVPTKVIYYVVQKIKFTKPFVIKKEIDADCIAYLSFAIKNLVLPITGYRGFEQAQVTSGGLDLNNFLTGKLEAKKIPGLYACGEIVDVDGDTGGYNLQWAWTSGMVAGKSCGKILAKIKGRKKSYDNRKY